MFVIKAAKVNQSVLFLQLLKSIYALVKEHLTVIPLLNLFTVLLSTLVPSSSLFCFVFTHCSHEPCFQTVLSKNRSDEFVVRTFCCFSHRAFNNFPPAVSAVLEEGHSVLLLVMILYSLSQRSDLSFLLQPSLFLTTS